MIFNATQLAYAMLDWETKKRELDGLAQNIQQTVLELAKTQTVGNVRASYSAGRKVYDYEAAAVSRLSPVEIEPFQVITIDYRAACRSLNSVSIPFTQGDPSVTVKLLEGE